MRIKWNLELVKHFIEIESGSGCKLVSKEYKKLSEKLDLTCKCGEPFTARFNHFIYENKRQCNDCGYEKKPRPQGTSYEQVKSKIESKNSCRLLTSEEEFYREVYENRKTPTRVTLKLSCEKCDSPFNTNLRRFTERNKTKCYSCSIEDRTWTLEEVKKFVEIDSESNCKLISKTYSGVREKLKFQCYCGNEFRTTFHKFKNLYQRQCQHHSMSIHEEKIKEYLKRNKITFDCQHTFDDCRGSRGKLLEFDFAIFDGDQVLTLIEYDGEQHFHAYEYFGGIKGLEYRQKNDEIKNDYCKRHDIKLIRIPYWKRKNIESILNEYFMKEGVLIG